MDQLLIAHNQPGNMDSNPSTAGDVPYITLWIDLGHHNTCGWPGTTKNPFY